MQRAARLGRAGHGQFAVRKERFFAARRAGENRAVISGAEQIDAHVHFGGVVQAARAQLDVLESVAIGAQRGIVIHATGHVGPVAGLDLAASGLLEIEDVERLRRIGDHLGSFPGVLSQAAALEEGGHAAKRSHVGAGG